MAAEKTDKEIARRLGGTAKQVSQQKARLLARLQINRPSRSPTQQSDRAAWPRYRGIHRNLAGETTRTSLVGTVGAHQTIH
ncbi:hypothetical protein BJS_09005 [Bradyrhizobium japonicum SEMIA 5079]|nr:hypothetical protein BJS_09005 [Bradyrhizobium japonicum SEMIA 5079]